MVTMGLLKGHHTLSVLGSLNEKEMDKKKKGRMKERTILAAGQVKIKVLVGLSAAGISFSLHESGLTTRKEANKQRETKTRGEVGAPAPQTCAGSGGDLGGSPARSPLSLVAVHNGVSLTALPPKLHRKAVPHLYGKQKVVINIYSTLK